MSILDKLFKPKEPICTEFQAKQVGNKCPQCGEVRTTMEVLSTTGKVGGIIGNEGLRMESDEYGSMFDNNIYHRYHYHCNTCGCDWQSPRFKREYQVTTTIFPNTYNEK